MKATLNTDGACLGNPGPMGLGIVLRLSDNTIKKSIPYGQGTNNIAEYSALIKGLHLALEKKVTDLLARLDSKLVVEQVRGNWQVRDPKLHSLHSEALQLAAKFGSFSIEYVPRMQNSVADELSKRAAEKV